MSAREIEALYKRGVLSHAHFNMTSSNLPSNLGYRIRFIVEYIADLLSLITPSLDLHTQP